MSICLKCNRKTHKKITRNIYGLKSIFGDHTHYGVAKHEYNICPKNHLTKGRLINIEWSPCLKCLEKNIGKYTRLKTLPKFPLYYE